MSTVPSDGDISDFEFEASSVGAPEQTRSSDPHLVYVLTCARESATKTRNYNYVATRQSIETKFQAAFDGKAPYSWQTDVTEAVMLGLDCVVIAGTGTGKTMPFGMPLLLDEAKDKMVVVISPLNELEAEQAERFHKLGLTATAVNADVYNGQLHKEIEEHKHRVLLTSPEMCLDIRSFQNSCAPRSSLQKI